MIPAYLIISKMKEGKGRERGRGEEEKRRRGEEEKRRRGEEEGREGIHYIYHESTKVNESSSLLYRDDRSDVEDAKEPQGREEKS